MATNDLESLAEGEFWRFSLDFYRRGGVEAACLRLQDDFGLDVNIVLFCLWAGSRGHFIEAGRLAEMTAEAAAWQTQVVIPLRQARRWLKTQNLSDRPKAEALRQAIKGQELRAEALEQELLYAQLGEAVGRADPQATAANLRRYLVIQNILWDREIKCIFVSMLEQLFNDVSEDMLTANLDAALV